MNISHRDLSILREAFSEEDAFSSAVERVENGEPLAYVLGEWYFYGLTFKLNSECLIPRADTEHIVEKAIELLPRGGRFIDLCSGSGCIAVSILYSRPDVTGAVVEISSDAYGISCENAVLNGVSDRLTAVNDDIFKFTTEEKYNCVISNPPYIRSSVIPTLDASVKDHEPMRALDGGDSGMDFYDHILRSYRECLAPDGCFVFEIGYDQREDICALAESLGYKECIVTKDYGGNDRVAVIRP